jgi:4'-phosphopantetheinyl transferase
MHPNIAVGALPTSDIVHVWRVSIGDSPVASLAALLSEEECARAARFVFDRDRGQFIAVRGWLRRLLGEYLNRSPRDIRFALGSHGKPMLADGDDNLYFNVSHSRDVGLLAFCRGREIGIDVEQADGGAGIDDLARSCFSTTEQESLRLLRGNARVDRFFQLWTAKEAYIKAIGRGLSIPLQDFTVDVRGETDIWTVATSGDTDEGAPLSVQRIPVPFGYAGAVAAIGSSWQVCTRDLPQI